ncbi:MAG: TonB-dependent receptor plug domain-containing protein, partial [Acidobacteria bacterium]|nr:TonB-dependent receptor plug domain-containing protein [Acidobacteriota bacterium]
MRADGRSCPRIPPPHSTRGPWPRRREPDGAPALSFRSSSSGLACAAERRSPGASPLHRSIGAAWRKLEMRCRLSRVRPAAVLAVLLILAGALPAGGQEGAAVTGMVADVQNLALPGVAVVLRTTEEGFVASAISDRTGRFAIPNVAPGNYQLVASLLGFTTHEEAITVGTSGANTAIVLEIGSFSQEVTVSALMPEVANELIITADEIERRVAQDLAQSLRDHAGVTALRRGAINLDPSVRGLYAEQIGVFVDGTRTFAAGPARMDSGLSHVSPHALQSLHVVRGPYALTWGAGTLTAIRADTFKPAFSGGAFEIGGRAGYNYGSNGGANDALASLYGSSDRIRFTFQHNTRTGSDYTAGGGATVQGDYESFDTRWSLGGRLGTRTLLEYTGGYQKQNDIDYPGRILDATFFETQSHSLDVSHQRPSGLVSEVAAQVYLNAKSHLMNNDNKPTALANPQRTPPFAIDVDLPTSSDTLGGRFHATLTTGPLSYKLGFDTYRLQQNATQTVSDRDTGQIHHNMHPVWPEAEIVNVGGYAQVVYDLARSTIGGTVRIDREQARVGGVTQFFAENAVPAYGLHEVHGHFHLQAPAHGGHQMGGHGMLGHGTGRHSAGPAMLVSAAHFGQTKVSVSAAANASLRITARWLVNLGAARAVRHP